MSIKYIIIDTINDLALDFLLYDRINDEELSVAQLRDAIDSEITLEEIAQTFLEALKEHREE